jgi:hypothetical protein
MIKGTLVTVWSDGETISTTSQLNESTGELSTETVDADPSGCLEEETFVDERGREYSVCMTCHEYILKTAMVDNPNDPKDHSLYETKVCSNPDCTE